MTQKTVTLATPSEEPVTVSMLYLSSDLKVILLYLENSSDSADTFKVRGCHLMKLNSGSLRCWKTWTKLPRADAQPHNKIKAVDETFWIGRNQKDLMNISEDLQQTMLKSDWVCRAKIHSTRGQSCCISKNGIFSGYTSVFLFHFFLQLLSAVIMEPEKAKCSQ